ncbi:MAG: polysaccharide biosynthesis protein, partial [Chloroflexota bacterium]
AVVVFSRDEAKQNAMRLDYEQRRVATDEVVYADHHSKLRFAIGDIADESSVHSAIREADVIFHAAALKQVPSCEYFPWQAVKTNVLGAENIVRVIKKHGLPVNSVIGISTDKACKPVNVMGMTKALQERLFVQANLDCPNTRFVAARYGNVMGTRGSVIPLFLDQVAHGGPVTLTRSDMTRFMMTLDGAIDTVFAALVAARRGEIYIPMVPAARIGDVAAAMIGDRHIEIVETGLRPGEKVHEILVSEEEASRTFKRGDHLVITPALPELAQPLEGPAMTAEYSSSAPLLDAPALARLLDEQGMLPPLTPALV